MVSKIHFGDTELVEGVELQGAPTAVAAVVVSITEALLDGGDLP